MSILTITSAAIVGVLLSLALKKTNPQFSIVLIVLCGVLILLSVLSGFGKIFDFSKTFADISGVSNDNFKLLIKAVGIGYIAQFGANVCQSAGEQPLAEKVELAAKIIILCMCLPLVENLFEIVEKISGIV
ncbi:MAG: hypothetical protein DBX47_04350 [Clostridiales bacterium]|nr:MAG: hypothetical protein DBX47_04350 [Clostridiales bacterium]